MLLNKYQTSKTKLQTKGYTNSKPTCRKSRFLPRGSYVIQYLLRSLMAVLLNDDYGQQTFIIKYLFPTFVR